MDPQMKVIKEIKDCLRLAEACFQADATAAGERGAILVGQARDKLNCLTLDAAAPIQINDRYLELLLSDDKGALLREWRERVGWTQVELASATGIPQSSVSRIETGYQGIPLDAFVKLIRTLSAREAALQVEQGIAPNSGGHGPLPRIS
jgi:DNA-binding XRE family transcriptional regulator